MMFTFLHKNSVRKFLYQAVHGLTLILSVGSGIAYLRTIPAH